MRPCLYALLCATSFLVGGCSHLSESTHGEWLTREHVAEADPTASSKDASGWAVTKAAASGNEAGLVVTPISNKPADAVARSDGPYLLDTGDQLRIFVYGQPNLSRLYTVDHKGNVMIPLIGVVRAQQRTTYQLASAIRAQLGTMYVRDPQVTVDIHQNRPFFILGEVRTPGQYPYVNGMTVETAVAIAGGYTPRARESNFRISRRVDGVVEVDRGGIDYVIRPGDTIKVTERFF